MNSKLSTNLIIKIVGGVIVICLLYVATLWGFDNLISKDTAGNAFKNTCAVAAPLDKKIYFGTARPDAGNNCSGEKYLRDGWANKDERGVWTSSPAGSISVNTGDWPKRDVIATFDVNTYTGFNFYKGTQTVTVFVEGEKSAEWIFTTGEKLPSTVLNIKKSVHENKNKSIAIKFQTDPVMNPKKLGVSEDMRDLGMHLMGLTLN